MLTGVRTGGRSGDHQHQLGRRGDRRLRPGITVNCVAKATPDRHDRHRPGEPLAHGLRDGIGSDESAAHRQGRAAGITPTGKSR